jgi:hypothetical protein
MKTMLILLMLANSADSALTMRNRDRARFHEQNPLMRPVTAAGKPAIGITFATASVGEWIAARKLARTHRRWAEAGLSLSLAGEAWSVQESGRFPCLGCVKTGGKR